MQRHLFQRASEAGGGRAKFAPVVPKIPSGLWEAEIEKGASPIAPRVGFDARKEMRVPSATWSDEF